MVSEDAVYIENATYEVYRSDDDNTSARGLEYCQPLL